MFTSTTPMVPGTAISTDPGKMVAQLTSLLKEKTSRKQKPVKMKGAIFLSTLMTLKEFMKAYDESFTGTIYTPPSGDVDKKTSQPLLIKSIIFIPELCSCLPMPSGGFVGKLLALKPKVSSGGKKQDILKEQAEIIRKKLKVNNNPQAKLDFDRISRFPVGFSLLAGDAQIPPPMQPVQVEFQRDYDYSKCVILDYIKD